MYVRRKNRSQERSDAACLREFLREAGYTTEHVMYFVMYSSSGPTANRCYRVRRDEHLLKHL
ncbi:hypothetical protein X777_16897 [Ooceraea biroi]|uniref:Uncharacterized protein n=1 Tax=Ooceraea biroi TaxID=2015173 RepID=A0A026WSI0_OOCBI|nr:hypothetical protein X777_16897 [Ooceraea biroi]